jgi:predicted amidophosphoribosyltransferase
MLADHAYLNSEDECYFVWEYSPGSLAHPATRFIHELKALGAPNAARKTAAIHFAADAISASLPGSWRESATFVPMPSSKTKGHPDHDTRIARLLGWVRPGLADVRNLLQVRADTPSLQKGVVPLDRAANLIVTPEVNRPAPPSTIVLVDDVITSGAHFRAAVLALHEKCAPKKVIGLFLCRTVRGNSEAARSGA